MLRSIAVLLLSLALLAPTHADAYKDPNGRFQVTFPDGWTNEELSDRSKITFFAKRDQTSSSRNGGLCLGTHEEEPQSRKQSQDEVNAEVDSMLTPEFWREVVKLAARGNTQVTIDSTGSRKQAGRTIHHAIYTTTIKGDDTGFSMKAKMELHFVPGAMHGVMCMTLSDFYAASSPDFEAIFTSYEPNLDTLISSSERPAPSVLTMFEKANYTGVARTLSKDTPDLAEAGWPTSSASLTVDGVQSWQVCTGANYTGLCRTIAGLENPQGRTLQITSARRLQSRPAFWNLATTAFRRAFQHPVVQKQLQR